MNASVSAINSNVNFVEVDFELIADVMAVPVDLFIRMSDVRYIKIYNSNEPDLTDVVYKYVERKLESFYCKKSDYEELTTFLLSQNGKVSNVTRVDLLQNILSIFGVTPQLKQQIEDIISQNIKNINSDKKLGMLLNEMLLKGDYLSQHSTMVSYVACVLAKKMDWCNGAVLEKLSLAGILHDMFLTTDILLTVKESRSDKNKLTWRQQKKYQSHVNDVVELLNNAPQIPIDVGDIIMDHHQFSDDGMFPTTKSSSSISQVSALFILSDLFCHSVHGNNSISLDVFLDEWPKFYERFNTGNFKKPLACLDDFIHNEK